MKKLLIIAALMFPFAVNANPYDWKVVRTVDGDTVEVEATWLPAELGKTIRIRIYGVDTPEKGGRAKCEAEAMLGAKATEFTKKFVASKNVVIEIKEWDKFGGRILGDVMVNKRSLRAELISKGYAREYFGDAKKSWCE
jgi:endonuclease YncB( thermonuclease family)